MSKDLSFTVDTDLNSISFREERRRTGRYVAVALAICITLLGLYQAVVQHTPVVAGLFAPAIIMFLYVFWVLYTASKTPKQLELEDDYLESKENFDETNLIDVTVNPVSSNDCPSTSKDVNILIPLELEDKATLEKTFRHKLNRTYSIA